MDTIPRKVREVIEEEADGAVVAVGHYSEDGVEILHTPDTHYTEKQFEAVLEDLRFQPLSQVAHTHEHHDQLRVLTQTYEAVAEFTILIGRHEGVVFALDRDGEYAWRRLLRRIEHTVEEYGIGVDPAALT